MLSKKVSLLSVVTLTQLMTLLMGCDINLNNISCICQSSTLLCTGAMTERTDLISVVVNVFVVHHSSAMLESISINVNNLTLSSNSSFEKSDLRNLTLGFGLDVLPDNLFVEIFDSLISLNLQNNSFHEVPGNALYILHRLEHLDLSFNVITDLTKDNFDGLKSLKILILEHNLIRNIDGETFFFLENLEYLSLENNEIQQLGITVFDNLQHLTYLSLSHNKLQAFEPETFTQLSSLLRLKLDYNLFLHLQNISFSSESLAHLSAMYCPFQGSITHSDLQNLPSLETLDLTFNRFDLIEEFALSSLQQLKVLNLSHSTIRELKENSFANLVNLEELDLSYNSLFIIRTGAFFKLTKLIHLDLSHNKLGAFLCRYTSDLLALEQINLEENKLKFIEAGAFMYSLHLKSIKLKGNNWDCSCALSQFAEYLRNSTVIDKTDIDLITCSNLPKSVRIIDADYKTIHGKQCHAVAPCKSQTFPTTEATVLPTTGTSTLETLFTTSPFANINTHETPTVNENISSIIAFATTTPTLNTNTHKISTDSESTLSSLPVTTSSVTTMLNTLESLGEISETTFESSSMPSSLKPATSTSSESTLSSLPVTTSSVTMMLNTLESLGEISETTFESSSMPSSLKPATSTSTLFISTPVSRYASDSTSTVGTLVNHDIKDDFEILIKNHSYISGDLCVEWIVNGILPSERLLCILSYTYPTPSPSSSVHEESNEKIRFACPVGNQLKKECHKISKVDSMHQFCMQIFKHADKQLLADSCIVYNEETTSDNPTSIFPHIPKITTDSLLYITTPPVNDTTITTPITTISPTTSTTLPPTTSTTLPPTTSTTLPPTTTTTLSAKTTTTFSPTVTTSPSTSDIAIFSSPTATTTLSSTPNTPSITPATSTVNVTTSVINILMKSTSKANVLEFFNITYLNFVFIDDTELQINWKVSRKEPSFACHLVLKIWNENLNHTNLTFPCADSTQVVGGLLKQDDYKLCLTAVHITFGLIPVCHPILSVSQEYSTAAQSQSSFFTLPVIVLIGLLIVVILVVVLLATRNVLRKPAVSERYNVSAEEKRVQRREKRESNTPSVRYSYVANDALETV